MSATAAKLLMQPLRIAVLAAEPRRSESLSRLVRDLGHVVAAPGDAPSVVLTDGVAAAGNYPTVALGMEGENYQARLPKDASAEQIDAALRAVAVGLSVTIAEELGRGFEALHDEDEQPLLTPREVEVLTAVSKNDR